ncbi:MAG TPA: riboflavin synthase [Planctomycetaceae bacterium]|nr:riboflavin synthase [Planctomycetaceae bacterium]
MFSGLVEAKAAVLAIQPEPAAVRIVLQRPERMDDIQLGDSICVQGCCLTVVAFDQQSMSFQAGLETLSRTTLGQLKSGHSVNCERSLRLSDRLGGHLVTGHIDGLGKVASRSDQAEWSNIFIEADVDLMRQMAPKGSITVDGVSLTLVHVDSTQFSVALIPHTLAMTTLGQLAVGDLVNLETDILAKYVQRQLLMAVTLN